jgi:polysaccharide deacetylase family protein (PEP-CTERM system associated)
MTAGKAIFSIDVEEWYHAAVIERYVPRAEWTRQELRLGHNMGVLDGLLEAQSCKATLFCLGSLPKVHHALLRQWAERGHEVASHGMSHQKLNLLSRTALLAELRDSKKLLEDVTGQEVRGFRAPNFSITDVALECLQEAGYGYDSSVFDLKLHKNYGKLQQHVTMSRPYAIRPGLIELPLSVLPWAGFQLPWSGGAYFRHFPTNFFVRGAEFLAKSGYYHFYIHPWEVDCAHPQPKGMKKLDKIRHFRNIEKSEERLKLLLTKLEFDTAAQFMAQWQAAH